MSRTKKHLAVLLAVVMVLCLVPAMVFGAGDDGQVVRISGNDRYATSAETALEAFPDGAETVIIARGDEDGNFADGLAASFLAGVKDAPILLTKPNELPDVVKDAIIALGAENAIILGGPAVITNNVTSELTGLDVERVYGANRYETAAKIAAKGGSADTAFVVSGYAPADSLVAGPLAFSNGYPVLLADDNNINFALGAIDELGIKNIIVVGGTGVVTENVYNQLAAKVDNIARFGGQNRVETSLKVVELYTDPKDFSIVGYNGLADAVGAAVFGNPIIYVSGEDVSNIAELESVTPETNFFIFGGTGVVSGEVEAALGELLVPEVDKTALAEAIANAETLQEEDYTPDTWAVFADALEAAKAVLNDEEATQEDVDEAVANLNAAIEGLEEVLVVKSVSAINANTISVTFEGIEEPVEIELEEALVHGENEVTFEYEGQTFTVTVNYEDPEVVEEEKAEAIKNAIDKINAIGKPATLTLEDEAKVVAARTAVNAAKELGAVDADIVNLDHLIAAETQINALKEALNEKETAIQEANVALTNLPLEVTLEDKEQVEEARELVNKALELGAEENDFVNLWKLTDAEAKIAELEEEAAEAEAVQAVIDAIDALPEEITLEDAEAVADARAAYDALTEEQQELVTNVDVLEAAEAKIAELEEEAAKKVTVTKIVKVEKKRVTVEIKPYDKDRFGEEIEILDNNGNKVAVKPVDIAAGDIEVVFEFVTPFEDDDFEGVWTVGGIEKDFDLENNLEAFKKETDQLKFVEVLNELGIENVEVANIPAYMGDARTNFLKELKEDKKDLTVEAIQEFINEVNAKEEEKRTEAEVKEKAAKAVVDAYVAGNDVALKIALENEVFDRFNSKWLEKYKTEFAKNTDPYTEAIAEGATADDIQARLDAVNETELEAINVNEVVDRAKLNEYKELIDTYAKKDKDGKIEDTEVAKLPKAIDIQLAIVDVREATTPTRLKSALEKLAELTKGEETKFEMKDYKDENAKYYINGIAAEELATGQPTSDVNGIKKADVKNVAAINTVITNVNNAVTAAEGEMEARINTLTVRVTDNPNYDSSKKGKIHILGYTVNIGLKEGTKFSDAESVVVKLYRDKEELGKIELRDPSSKTSSGPMDGTIDLYGDYDSTSWAHEWYGELTDMPNRAVATVTFKDGVAVKELKTLPQVTEETVKPFYRELANRAETVEEMDAALLKLAEIGNYDYLNVPKADRLYVAEQVLEARNAVENTKKFAAYTDLTNALSGIVGTEGTYTKALAAVNKLNEDSQIADVIAALSFDEGFAKMSVKEKADIAEAFFNSLFEDGEFVAPNFRTLAAVKAAAGL